MSTLSIAAIAPEINPENKPQCKPTGAYECVDIATGWIKQRAVWQEDEVGVVEQIKNAETSLPFSSLVLTAITETSS